MWPILTSLSSSVHFFFLIELKLESVDYIMSWEGAQVHVSWRREALENLSHPMYPFYFNNRSLGQGALLMLPQVTCPQAGVEEESLYLTVLTGAYRIER